MFDRNRMSGRTELGAGTKNRASGGAGAFRGRYRLALALLQGLVYVAPWTLVVTGCGSARDAGPRSEGAAYLLRDEPASSLPVIQARVEAAAGQPIVVVGRIGGSVNPWIEGRAAFSIVDTTLKACSDNPGDHCPCPWDYCCLLNELPAATALVKIVDAQQQLVPIDARELLGLKELQTVVVQGTAQRDEAGNLTILTSAIFVRKS